MWVGELGAGTGKFGQVVAFDPEAETVVVQQDGGTITVAAEDVSGVLSV